ncbi:MAG: lysostaphin resistance A-like protein [Chitinophagaceae bacterium]
MKVLFTHPNLLAIVLFNLIPQIIWGFYQELLYRGILQTEFVKRFGSWKGIVASNLIFTFGPLHAYHFLSAPKNPSHLWIFAAIFGIGLIFAIIFKRSGNLWIIGIMHGIGNMFINGLTKI